MRRGIRLELPIATTLALACLLASSWHEASAAGGFGPKTDFPAGTSPIQVAIGDLNGDGKLDLALANNTTPGVVSVLLGDGVGGFGTNSPFPTADGSWSVVIGDLDGDGKPDLAVANRVSSNVSVMINTTPAGGTNPSFTHILPDFQTGNGPTEVAIGDLNSDGKLDLVTANSFAGTVSVLINSTPLGGPATFQRLNPDPVAGTGPTSVAIGDLDRNGTLDLAVANHQSSNVSVLLGHGDGTFGLHNELTIGAESYSVAIGDLNRDGKPDLATASYVSNTVSVLFGNGNGTFGPKSDIAVGGPTTAVSIGDLNQDGKLDLAATHDVPSVSVVLGNGNGTFGPNADFATGDGPSWVAIADLDGDGRPDLAVSDNNSNMVSVLLNTLSHSTIPLAFRSHRDFATGAAPLSVAIGDLNGDSRPDVATANSIANTVSVLLGNGDGTLAPKSDFGTGLTPYSVAIGDFNGDGKRDLVTANVRIFGLDGSVSLLLGNGDGTFGPPSDFTVGIDPALVAIGDLNRDGKLDLVTANYDVPGAPGTVSVLLGNGVGGFGPHTEFATGTGPWSVAIEDLNRDGKPDLATANREAFTVSVLLGNGLGSFGPKTDFPTGTRPFSVVAGDLDRDGKLDVATANLDAGTVSLLLGNGDGTFGSHTDFATGSGVSLAMGDLNRDGKPDLAMANWNAAVEVLLGNGAGGFAPHSDFATDSNPFSVAIGDLNGDGALDLATANESPNTVSVLLNTTPLVDVPPGAPVTEFALGPVTPNPSRSTARVPFALPRETRVRLRVVDVQGRSVAELANRVFPAGRHEVTWDGTKPGGAAPAGMYFVSYEGGGQTLVRRLVMAR